MRGRPIINRETLPEDLRSEVSISFRIVSFGRRPSIPLFSGRRIRNYSPKKEKAARLGRPITVEIGGKKHTPVVLAFVGIHLGSGSFPESGPAGVQMDFLSPVMTDPATIFSRMSSHRSLPFIPSIKKSRANPSIWVLVLATIPPAFFRLSFIPDSDSPRLDKSSVPGRPGLKNNPA